MESKSSAARRRYVAALVSGGMGRLSKSASCTGSPASRSGHPRSSRVPVLQTYQAFEHQQHGDHRAENDASPFEEFLESSHGDCP